MIRVRSISIILGAALLATALPTVALGQDAEPAASPESTATAADLPGGDLAAVLAALAALEARFADLEERMTAVEAGAGADKTPPKPTKPAAAAIKGKVKTEFPDWMRDSFRPEAERSDERNRETVSWKDRAKDEAGYNVYARRRFCELKPNADSTRELKDKDFRAGRGESVLIEQLPVGSTEYQPDHAAIDAALPTAPESPYSSDQFYDLLVSTFNDVGESRTKLVGSYFLTPEYRCP
jgi:hypothetical protein